MIEVIDDCDVIEAGTNESDEVAQQVIKLLLELEPGACQEIESMCLPQITRTLLSDGKIVAFLAKANNQTVGVLTLHECAAIYAGGVFGEISELYVEPAYRSQDVGRLLLDSALHKARQRGWSRLEVGTPTVAEEGRSLKFYERNQFKATGVRLRRLVL